MYPNYNYNLYGRRRRRNDDRFILPFLVGAVTGGAAVGLTRPRPIYNVAPVPQPIPIMPPPPPPMPMYPPYNPMPYY